MTWSLLHAKVFSCQAFPLRGHKRQRDGANLYLKYKKTVYRQQHVNYNRGTADSRQEPDPPPVRVPAGALAPIE
jgi:hypothetical protein